jgi:2-keto-4-pentenoate hydratase
MQRVEAAARLERQEQAEADASTAQLLGREGGEVVAQGKGANALGDPRVALTWLANELLSHGMCLRQGEVVITGTCVVPVPVEQGQQLAAQFPGLGEISVAIAL